MGRASSSASSYAASPAASHSPIDGSWRRERHRQRRFKRVLRGVGNVEHALAIGAFDPARLPELPDLSAFDDLAEPTGFPEGVQIGAEHRGVEETDVWSANVPTDVARLFRACLPLGRFRASGNAG